MGLELPCSEAGLAVDQPPLGIIDRQHLLIASAVLCVLNDHPLRRSASEGVGL